MSKNKNLLALGCGFIGFALMNFLTLWIDGLSAWSIFPPPPEGYFPVPVLLGGTAILFGAIGGILVGENL